MEPKPYHFVKKVLNKIQSICFPDKYSVMFFVSTNKLILHNVMGSEMNK